MGFLENGTIVPLPLQGLQVPMANQTDAFKVSPIQAKTKIAFEKPGLIHKTCMEFMEASFKIKFQIIVVIVYFLDQTNHMYF